MSILVKTICQYGEALIKTPMVFFTKLGKIIPTVYTCNSKNLTIQRTLPQEWHTRGVTHLISKCTTESE